MSDVLRGTNTGSSTRRSTRSSTRSSTKQAPQKPTRRAGAADDSDSVEGNGKRQRALNLALKHQPAVTAKLPSPVSEADALANQSALERDHETSGEACLYVTEVSSELPVVQESRTSVIIDEVRFQMHLPRVLHRDVGKEVVLKFEMKNLTNAEKCVPVPLTGPGLCSVMLRKRDHPDKILYNPYIAFRKEHPEAHSHSSIEVKGAQF
eukprot:TRINITY_DN3054_c0_g1_i1.p1 TRINITY_DN3054_c0_g1~~TRINITY_DN3054_c0_g1_i1.p1  ORF type:complete len:208 (-),score=22.33 TRINITY_DN3054_c0_g1_i1:537-1160(-)